MGRKNNVVSEYSVDYRRERLKYNKANYIDEHHLDSNRPVKKISHDDIKYNREIKSYSNGRPYMSSNSPVFLRSLRNERKPYKSPKTRIVLAIALLILLIASIAIVVTLVDTNFVIDMSNVFN